MSTDPENGHDGPYAAPIIITGQQVQPEWIDYNGHMNVAYYTLAIDTAIDGFLQDELGIGEAFAASARMGPYSMQANYRYLDEMHEGDMFSVRVTLLDHDRKRMHLFMEVVKSPSGAIAATMETLLMNVDLEARRSADYPDWAQARLARLQTAHDALPRPEGAGATLGIRRK